MGSVACNFRNTISLCRLLTEKAKTSSRPVNAFDGITSWLLMSPNDKNNNSKINARSHADNLLPDAKELLRAIIRSPCNLNFFSLESLRDL